MNELYYVLCRPDSIDGLCYTVLKTLPFFFPSKLRDKFFLNGMMKEWEKTIMYYPKWFHQYEQDISHSPNTNL